MSTEQTDAPHQPGPRLDVLAFPSPTTARYVVFAVAMLASGLFVGNYVHTMTMGDSWTRAIAVCEGRYGAGGTVAPVLAQQPAFVECTAGAERTRVAVTVAGAVAVAVVGAALMWVVPVVVQRRRRLRPVPDPLAGAARRFAELAERAGAGGGRVRPMLGPATQRDAFTFGSPGRYRTALPPAVAVRYRDSATFDPVVCHELAHVAHRDVTLAWLTRLVWWTLAPLLLLPIVVGLVENDLSLIGSYWWRATLLGLSVALLSSQLLREREYGADLRAARLGGTVPLIQVLRRSAGPGTSATARPWSRRLLDKHPTTQERLDVLEEPVRVTGTGFTDGLAGAFLSALALPLLVSTTSPLFALAGRSDLAYAAAATLLGPLLAGAVGMGVWRAALYARAGGGSAAPVAVSLGVGVGVLLGQAVSLSQAGLGSLTGSSRPGWLLVSGLLAAGAVAVTSGLAHLWADLSPRLPSAWTAWVPSLLLTSAIFGSMLWSSTLFQTAVDLGGWPLARATLPGLLSPWLMVAVVTGLALACGCALLARPRTRRPVPRWLCEEPGQAGWPGLKEPLPGLRAVAVCALLAGLGGAVTLVGYRLLAGPSTTGTATYERFLAYQWVAAVAAAAALAAAVAAWPRRGPGAALLAGPLAALVVMAGFLALNLGLGGGLDGPLVRGFLRPAVVLGFYATLLVALPFVLIAEAVRRTGPPGGVPARLAMASAVPAVVLAGSAVLASRSDLVSLEVPDTAFGDLLDTEQDTTQALRTEFGDYLSTVVPTVTRGLGAASAEAQRILSDPAAAPAQRAEAIQRRVVEPLERLTEEMAARPTGAAEITTLHREVTAALRLETRRYALVVANGGVVGGAVVAEAQALLAEESRHWQRWRELREELAARLLAS